MNGVKKALISYSSSSVWTAGSTAQPLAQGTQYYTAESTPGDYSAPFTITATWTSIGSGYTKTQSKSISYSVVGNENQTGVVTVNSYVAGTQTPVTATFDLDDKNDSSKDIHASSVSLQNATGTVGHTFELDNVSAAESGYAVKDIKVVGGTVAETHWSFFGNILAMLESPFQKAEAEQISVTAGSKTTNTNSYALPPSGMAFEIDWTPTGGSTHHAC